MASEVDICNLALAHLGDNATVASLDPPEGSAQAEHCSRFYPLARDTLLEMHAWGFATKRVQLALLSSGWTEWDYCYAVPSDALNLLAVIPPDATDDYAQSFATSNITGISTNYAPMTTAGQYVPQPYSAETLDDGTQVIYTDQVDAVLRYTARVTDTNRFSPLFVTTLSHHLAAFLAGPVIKGDAGAAESKRQAAMTMSYLGMAKESDANQRRSTVQQIVPWMAGR